MWARNGAAPSGGPEDSTNAETDMEDVGQIIRRRKAQIVEAKGEKKSRRGRATQKDVKNDDRSGNVYESKGPDDKMPDTKGDISAQSHAILLRNRRILQKPSALLSLLDRCGTNFSLQNVETRCGGF